MRHSQAAPADPRAADTSGWMASVETAYVAHESECAARLRSTELELEKLRLTLNRAMSSLAMAFHEQSASGNGGDSRLDAAVEAMQFHDIGGQWLAHIALHLRQTQQLVAALRVPFEAMRSAAQGDWHGFERGSEQWLRMSQSLAELRAGETAHPVGHALESLGDVELF